MFITLSCKHVFTVAALDAICELRKYYTQDEDGRWVDFAPPPKGFQQAPICPLCGCPVNSLRYGRVFKRANLDLSEQNIANSSRRSIQAVLRHFELFDAESAIKNFKMLLGRITFPDAQEQQVAKETQAPHILDTAPPLPVGVELLGDQVGSHFPLPAEAVTAWGKAAETLLLAYEQVVKVAENRPAHVQACEAAVIGLSHRYLEEFKHRREILKGGIKPHEKALDQAMRHCGLPAPFRAATRFRVEAFWITIGIRFLMIEVALGGIESVKDYSEGFKIARAVWMDFIGFLISSVEHDARNAIQLSQESQSHRQVVKTTLLLLEAQYATARHAAGVPKETVEGLRSRYRNGLTLAKRTIAETSQAYRHAMTGRQEDQEWVDKHFVQPGNGIVDKWEGLDERLSRGVFHSAISNGDNNAILEASMANTPVYSVREQFFQCPNGHVYVIAECGGSMERSRCPECGAMTSGDSQTPDRSNVIAIESKAPAKERGSQSWGQWLRSSMFSS
ncbi:hypothetical protein FRB96_002618 [Tulasnella sp. 330]|nr:hypothetical protein FRB96_002618 [Tulasnella sp. 330]KAG8872869.1 hypothetical protein FRB97_007275 [Tulasnella sp. 331]